MRGPDGVRDQLAALLGDVLPMKTEALRQAWTLGRRDLPDVDTIASGEIPENTVTNLGEVWVEVINPRLQPGMVQVDIDSAGYPVYRLRYGCRIYVWALGANWDNAMTRRDMVIGAVRMAIIEFPTLQVPPGDTGYLLHPTTYTEEYGVPSRAPNKSGRVWASALASIDLWSEESMADGALRPPLGTADQTEVATSVLGPGPAPADLPEPEPAPEPEPV